MPSAQETTMTLTIVLGTLGRLRTMLPRRLILLHLLLLLLIRGRIMLILGFRSACPEIEIIDHIEEPALHSTDDLITDAND